MDKFTKYSITIAPEDWEPTGPDAESDPDEPDPTARLLASINVNGCALHLEAFAVVDNDSCQEAAHAHFHDDVEALQNMQDTAFQTVEINGRTYILVATPHGS